MAFTQSDRLEVDSLIEDLFCSNLSKWLDLDQLIEVAFEVQKNRKNIKEDQARNKKRNTQKK